MGSENSKFLSEQELPHQYRPIKQLPGVYESILNGSRLQKHKLELNCQTEINYQKDIFIFRRMNADRVISAYFFQKFIPSHFCNMSYQVCFFTEYPSYVMSSDIIIPTQRAYQLLIECLKGFQILYQKFGGFNISFENIYFDSHHQPKMWISNDLGKTRVQHNASGRSNEQKMIYDIFKIFDQIKDERNATITFSNYLRKLQDKTFRNLIFKNVITYMVDQASKFFISRSKSDNRKIYFNSQKTQKNNPNNPTIANHSGVQSPKLKQNNPNVISLKTKTRNNSKNSNSQTSTGVCTFVSPFSITGKIAQSTGFTQIDKVKKSKRHNSQQDCPNKEFYPMREHPRNFYTQSHNTTPNYYNCNTVNSPSHVGVQFKQKNPGTIRMFRKSLEEFERAGYIQVRMPQNKTRRIIQNVKQVKVLNKGIIQRHPNFQAPPISIERQRQRQNRQNRQNKEIKSHHQVSFEPTIKNFSNNMELRQKFENNLSVNDHFGSIISPIKDYNESHMVLSNLQTLKSIVNSDYSDLDSQIRDDLQNLNI